jgi:hypothetical protein
VSSQWASCKHGGGGGGRLPPVGSSLQWQTTCSTPQGSQHCSCCFQWAWHFPGLRNVLGREMKHFHCQWYGYAPSCLSSHFFLLFSYLTFRIQLSDHTIPTPVHSRSCLLCSRGKNNCPVPLRGKASGPLYAGKWGGKYRKKMQLAQGLTWFPQANLAVFNSDGSEEGDLDSRNHFWIVFLGSYVRMQPLSWVPFLRRVVAFSVKGRWQQGRTSDSFYLSTQQQWPHHPQPTTAQTVLVLFT